MAASFALVLLGSGLILQTAATPLASSLNCCTLLDAEFRGEGKVVFPQTSEYGVLNTYFAPSSQQSPSCIFTPANTADVSRAIKLFTHKSCPFAVRSGGHHYNAGWASINNGILVSLSKLDTVTYNPDTGSVSFGAGNRWKKVYNTVEPHNVTVIGAQNADVGVGGFLINGGISYLSNEYGWAVDNVQDFEIVIASGQVLHANKHLNEALFRALKGGSSNFGVVTGFTMNTVKVNAISSIISWFPTSSYDVLIDAAYQYSINGIDEDTSSQLLIGSSINFNNGTVAVNTGAFITYADFMNVSNPPKVLTPFMDGTVPVTSVQPWVQNGTLGGLGESLSTLQPPGGRTTRQTISILPDPSLLKKLLGISVKMAEAYKHIEGFEADVMFQAIGKKWIAAGNAKGGNSMGLTQPVIIMWLQPHWKSSRDDQKVKEYVTKVIAEFEQLARKAGKLASFEYLNYAGPKQDLIKGYGQESVRHLQKVKGRYDPKNVFGTLLPGGPKIPGW